MVMFFIFLIVNIGTVGIFYAVYGGKREYSEGMLMGVHIPKSAAESEEVALFMKRYQSVTKRFYLLNGLAGAAMCAFCFWYISIFMVVWSIWLVELCVGGLGLLYRTHRKLYDLKMKKGWIGSGGSRIMSYDSIVDANMTSQSGKMGVSPCWHILFFAVELVPCILPGVRTYLKESEDGWVIFGVAIAVTIAFAVIHIIMMRVRNKVYSENSKLNFTVNQMQKNVWSWALLGSGFVHMLAYLCMVSFMNEQLWIGQMVYVAYVTLESMPAVFLTGGMFYIKKKREHLLQNVPDMMYVDDDIYWKNGWYNNPNDKKLLVQDWVCSFNCTTNMARPAGKIFLAAGVIFTVACLVWACVIMFRIDFTPMQVNFGESRLEITSGISDLEIGFDDIEHVEMLDKLPKDEYKRTNGSSDSKKMIGKFRGKKTGKCWMYLYVDCEPILKIDTAKGPVFINSENAGEVEEWYEQIRSL